MKKEILAISTLSGTIIGVGLFSLPYLTLKVGFWIILFYFVALTILVSLIHYFFGQLCLETPDYKRLPGFAKIYLGKIGQKFALVLSIFSLYGAILAYLIVGGEFLAEFFSPIFNKNSLLWTLFYFFAGATLVFFGIKIVAQVELWGLILFCLILLFVFLKSHSLIQIKNLFPVPDFSQIFLPYGPILFSLWGTALIPEIEEILRDRKKAFLKVILISTLIPALLYLFFIVLVLGICGKDTTESALPALKNFLSKEIFSLLIFFGILTTFTSFLTLSLTLKKVFWYDLHFPKNLSFLITCFPPLFLFLIGIKNFISVISFVGTVCFGLEGLLILKMYHKRFKNKISKLKIGLIYFLAFVLICGIIYEVIYFLK